jgi:hypothetical protein
LEKEKKMKKIINIDPFNDWMDEFLLPQTNEWQKKMNNIKG